MTRTTLNSLLRALWLISATTGILGGLVFATLALAQLTSHPFLARMGFAGGAPALLANLIGLIACLFIGPLRLILPRAAPGPASA
ncbi:hypothetical protein BH11PLA1_BH11PLA1_20530 [soil metagenome]